MDVRHEQRQPVSDDGKTDQSPRAGEQTSPQSLAESRRAVSPKPINVVFPSERDAVKAGDVPQPLTSRRTGIPATPAAVSKPAAIESIAQVLGQPHAQQLKEAEDLSPNGRAQTGSRLRAARRRRAERAAAGVPDRRTSATGIDAVYLDSFIRSAADTPASQRNELPDQSLEQGEANNAEVALFFENFHTMVCTDLGLIESRPRQPPRQDSDSDDDAYLASASDDGEVEHIPTVMRYVADEQAGLPMDPTGYTPKQLFATKLPIRQAQMKQFYTLYQDLIQRFREVSIEVKRAKVLGLIWAFAEVLDIESRTPSKLSELFESYLPSGPKDKYYRAHEATPTQSSASTITSMRYTKKSLATRYVKHSAAQRARKRYLRRDTLLAYEQVLLPVYQDSMRDTAQRVIVKALTVELASLLPELQCVKNQPESERSKFVTNVLSELSNIGRDIVYQEQVSVPQAIQSIVQELFSPVLITHYRDMRQLMRCFGKHFHALERAYKGSVLNRYAACTDAEIPSNKMRSELTQLQNMQLALTIYDIIYSAVLHYKIDALDKRFFKQTNPKQMALYRAAQQSISQWFEVVFVQHGDLSENRSRVQYYLSDLADWLVRVEMSRAEWSEAGRAGQFQAFMAQARHRLIIDRASEQWLEDNPGAKLNERGQRGSALMQTAWMGVDWHTAAHRKFRDVLFRYIARQDKNKSTLLKSIHVCHQAARELRNIQPLAKRHQPEIYRPFIQALLTNLRSLQDWVPPNDGLSKAIEHMRELSQGDRTQRRDYVSILMRVLKTQISILFTMQDRLHTWRLRDHTNLKFSEWRQSTLKHLRSAMALLDKVAGRVAQRSSLPYHSFYWSGVGAAHTATQQLHGISSLSARHYPERFENSLTDFFLELDEFKQWSYHSDALYEKIYWRLDGMHLSAERSSDFITVLPQVLDPYFSRLRYWAEKIAQWAPYDNVVNPTFAAWRVRAQACLDSATETETQIRSRFMGRDTQGQFTDNVTFSEQGSIIGGFDIMSDPNPMTVQESGGRVAVSPQPGSVEPMSVASPLGGGGTLDRRDATSSQGLYTVFEAFRANPTRPSAAVRAEAGSEEADDEVLYRGGLGYGDELDESGSWLHTQAVERAASLPDDSPSEYEEPLRRSILAQLIGDGDGYSEQPGPPRPGGW